jgi:hypothetical protein
MPTPDLDAFRRYLAARSSAPHAAKFSIPDEVAQAIQDDFVSRRKDGNTAEEGLKRRMRLARSVLLCSYLPELISRLMAISTSSASLDMDVWKRVLDLDGKLEARLQPPSTTQA